MQWLLDTNILLRLIELKASTHLDSLLSVRMLLRRGENLSITPQNLVEFWSVATRPATSNGLGLTTHLADEEVENLETQFSLLPDAPEIYPTWRKLVRAHQARGAHVHDARLVAVMLVNRVFHLLTFDTHDFQRYPEIVSVHPEEIRSGRK